MGRPAGPVSGHAPDGARSGVDVADGRWVLLFVTSSCRSCRALWEVLAAAPDGLGSGPWVVVTPGPSTESRRAVAALAPPGLAVVMSTDTWLAYSPGPAPWAVVVDGGVGVWEGPAPLDPSGLAALAVRPARP